MFCDVSVGLSNNIFLALIFSGNEFFFFMDYDWNRVSYLISYIFPRSLKRKDET